MILFVCNKVVFTEEFDLFECSWTCSKLKLWLESDVLSELKRGAIQKLTTLKLGDSKEILVPPVVNLSSLGLLDEVECELWRVILRYMSVFGIVLKGDNPDWFTVKQIQDEIIRQFKNAGVKFNFCEE